MKNKDIIVGVDFSESSKAAIREAGHIAHLRQSWLNVVHVIDAEFFEREIDSKFLTPDDLKRKAEDALRKLTLETLEVTPSLRFFVFIGHPFGELLAQTKLLECDLLVLGSYGNSGKGDHIGTTAANFVRRAPMPVLLVRENQRTPFENIVACHDFSETSQTALEYAAEFARVHGARLHLLHVHVDYPPTYAWAPMSGVMLSEDFYREHIAKLERRLEKLVPPLRKRFPELDVLSVVRRGGSAPSEIYDYVRKSRADLTVLGTRGRTGLKKLLLGTTAEKILHKCPSSVLAVKPADFKE